MNDLKKEYLAKKFASAINNQSVDVDLGTPDFILANYLIGCLELLETTEQQVDDFYQRGSDGE